MEQRQKEGEVYRSIFFFLDKKRKKKSTVIPLFNANLSPYHVWQLRIYYNFHI